MHPRFGRPGGRFVRGALLMLAATLALGGLVLVLWNSVLVRVFAGLPLLGYGQALGLLVLCRLLVGSWGPGRRHPGRDRPDFAKWQRLSPAERQQFRQRWQGRRFTPPGAREPE